VVGVYGGVCARRWGGVPPSRTVAITVGPDPITPDSHASTLHGRPHRRAGDGDGSPGSARPPSATAAIGHGLQAHGSAGKRSAWCALGRAWSPGSAGKRNASSALRHGTARYRRGRDARMPLGHRGIAHNRRGRGEAVLRRPDARMRQGAGYGRAGETCSSLAFFLYLPGHEKARVTLRCPGFACLVSTYRRRMRTSSAASRDPSEPRSGRRQNGPGLNRLRHSAE